MPPIFDTIARHHMMLRLSSPPPTDVEAAFTPMRQIYVCLIDYTHSAASALVQARGAMLMVAALRCR